MSHLHFPSHDHESNSVRQKVFQVIQHLERRFRPLSENLKNTITLYYLLENKGHTALPLHVPVSDIVTQSEWPTDSNEVLAGVTSQELLEEIASLDDHELFPFRINDGFFLPVRTWIMEQQIAEFIHNRTSGEEIGDDGHQHHLSDWVESLGDHVDDISLNPETLQAAGQLLTNRFTILSGGPGTGKTTAAATIILIWIRAQMKLSKQTKSPYSGFRKNSLISLTAPTGKAAARLRQQVSEILDQKGVTESERDWIPRNTTTLHRLLKPFQRTEVLPDPQREDLLPHALIVVDEASMMDMNVFHSLIKRIHSRTSLLLIGDPNQLESVHSGAVFRDLCTLENLADRYQVILTKNWRFQQQSGIAALSRQILSFDKGAASQGQEGKSPVETGQQLVSDEVNGNSFSTTFFYNSAYTDLHHVKCAKEELLKDHVYRYFEDRFSKISSQSADHILHLWADETWLTPLRSTDYGAEFLNRKVDEMLINKFFLQPVNGWFHGKPFIVTQNNYTFGVFNGDRGVCCRNGMGKLALFIETSEGLTEFSLSTPLQLEPAWFLTVHKSQGSEFDRVYLVIPNEVHPLVSRQLLYTALTRAKKEFTLYGDIELFEQACQTDQIRFTTLQKSLKRKAFS